MVNLSSIGWLALILIVQGPSTPAPPADPPVPVVRSALAKQKFPWYDEKTDAVKAVALRAQRANSESSGPSASGGLFGSLSSFLTMIGFGLALAVLIGLLVWFWKIYEPNDLEKENREGTKRGEPSRVESLPESMKREFESSDPWEEAIRRRDRGDLSGAVICLFAHQLLTLSRLGLVRLAPGRTGRQLVKAVTDPELRALVQPTLRLFEIVFYGQRSPTEAEFALVWSGAEAFERRVAAGVVR